MDAAEAIIEEIRAAFAGVRRGEISLHEAEVIDEYGSDESREMARTQDVENCWEDVPDSHIEECTTALCHVDPESWRYYVPAYMCWALRHFETSSSIVVDFTIYTFKPSELDDSVLNYQMKRYELLNKAQCKAVCRFLQYMANCNRADSDAAKTALVEYWRRRRDKNA